MFGNYSLFEIMLQLLSGRIEEDNLFWNCATMGNKVCDSNHNFGG